MFCKHVRYSDRSDRISEVSDTIPEAELVRMTPERAAPLTGGPITELARGAAATWSQIRSAVTTVVVNRTVKEPPAASIAAPMPSSTSSCVAEENWAWPPVVVSWSNHSSRV